MAAARRDAGGPDGYVVIDKPAGCTSHDVVARARRVLGTRRIGHGGTLDPGATGVLVLGVGRATRLLQFVSGMDKSYAGEIVLGTTTTTYDDEGEVTARFSMEAITTEEVAAAAAALTGTLAQVPPMVSAIKVDGTRLYELARQGIEVERAAREVVVTRFSVGATSEPGVFSFVVDCSSGTYVRSLVADLGVALGGGAHLRRLRRRAVGPFDLADAVGLDDLVPEALRPPLGLVGHLATIEADPALCVAVGHGKVLERRAVGAVGDGPFAVTDGAGRLLGVYAAWREDRLKPAVILVGAEALAGEPGALRAEQ